MGLILLGVLSNAEIDELFGRGVEVLCEEGYFVECLGYFYALKGHFVMFFFD